MSTLVERDRFDKLMKDMGYCIDKDKDGSYTDPDVELYYGYWFAGWTDRNDALAKIEQIQIDALGSEMLELQQTCIKYRKLLKECKELFDVTFVGDVQCDLRKHLEEVLGENSESGDKQERTSHHNC